MRKLLLVDDQVLFVESLRSVLQARGKDFEVVGVAYDGQSGIRLAYELSPDVILMDVRMPDLSGVEATKEILTRAPDTKIVMLTTFEDDEAVKTAINAGAVGFLLKDMTPQGLIDSLHTALSGVFLTTTSIAYRLGEAREGIYSVGDVVGGANLPEWYFVLSRKERHILRLVIEGNNNEEIAEQVHLASQTVRNYLSRVYEELDVHGRLEAIKKTRSFLNYL